MHDGWISLVSQRIAGAVVCQDVLEELDPSIEPVLSKAIIKQGNREVVRLGDKELDWSHDFRLYITTKLGNPHYTPEVNDDASTLKMHDTTEIDLRDMCTYSTI